MTATSMTGKAYTELRALLLGGTVHPKQRLVEMDLVESLGVNRAAVREALAKLEQEGLVERRANRGVTVREVTPQEAYDVIEMRIAIESLAVRWACERQTPEQCEVLRSLLQHMDQLHADGDIPGFVQQQARVHHAILDMADSTMLSGVVHGLSAQTAQIRRRSLSTPGRVPESLAEHQRIAQAILDRDPDQAALEMTQHLRHVQALVIWD